MQTLPSAPQAEETTEFDNGNQEQLMALDAHLNALPPEAQQIFESGFKEYPKLPEVLGVLMPDAYEYFKMVQQGVVNAASAQNSPAAPSSQGIPAGEPAQAPLMGSATPPAKATSAFQGMSQ